MKNKNFITVFGIMFCIISLSACSSLTEFVNYTYKHGPRYALFRHTKQHKIHGKNIKVVSYNIKHSKKMKEAIELLEEKGFADADVILLQEMTPNGVKEIADALNYNYVFYPAVHHPILKTGFGNAVVSKWPIIEDHKVILKPVKEGARQRIAVGATLEINNEKVVVYSLHMGVFVNPLQRKQIVHALLAPVAENTTYCIVGGDFNTFTERDREFVNNTFSEADFSLATSSVDWTYNQWYFMNRKSVLDHIYIKGLEQVQSGKIEDNSVSDHLPVWAELAFKEETSLR